MNKTKDFSTDNEDNPYSVLACIYELWQEDDETEKGANFIEKIIKEHCQIIRGQGQEGKLLLADLGCGTGQMSFAMSSKGYDVLGIDNSPEMLAEAYSNQSEKQNEVRFICQDICDLDLFGTVDVMICILDTVNHITSLEKLESFFKICKRYLNPGGVLIFDIATLKHFEKTLNNNSFVQTGEDYAVIWQNFYSVEKKLNDAFITVFTSNDGILYERFETIIKEKYYEPEIITQLLQENNLIVEAIYGDKRTEKPKSLDERIFFVVKNKNDIQKESLITE